jgi:pyridoxine kinase
VECAILPPAILSNHTGGFKTWSFADLTGEISKVEAKWIEQGIKFDAFYTGYVCESHIDPILSIVKNCALPDAVRFVDPAMADNGVLYKGFADDFPAKMARLCDGADYILPNLTEAALLVGAKPKLSGYTQGEIEELIERLHALGAKNVILTGVSFDPALLGSAISDGKRVEYDFNDRLERMSHGTGDVFASVFAGAIMRGLSSFKASALASDIVCEAIAATSDDHWYGVCFEKTIPALASYFTN